MVFSAGLMLAAAAGMRAWRTSDTELTQQGISRRKLFKRRLVHAMMVLGTVAHVQLCLRCLQGLVCVVDAEGTHRLLQEPTLVCYSDFPATFGIILVLVPFYVVGFPALCWWVLYRGVLKSRSPGQDESSAAETSVTDRSDSAVPPLKPAASVRHSALYTSKRFAKYGFLHRGLRVSIVCEAGLNVVCWQDRYWWFRLVAFPVSLVLAVQQTATNSISLRTFLALFGCSVEVVLIAALLPFTKPSSNVVRTIRIVPPY